MGTGHQGVRVQADQLIVGLLAGGDMLLMIDNYDSFTFNLVQYLGELGEQVKTVRNDAISLDGADTPGGGFLHAMTGCYPLLPLFRRLGFRSPREIARERYALKALRGDFQGMYIARTARKAAGRGAARMPFEPRRGCRYDRGRRLAGHRYPSRAQHAAGD